MRTFNNFEVPAKKETVLNALRRQREKHEQDFKLAVKGYMTLMKERAAELHNEVMKAETFEEMQKVRTSRVLLQEPTCYKQVFDEAIEMCEICDSDTIMLSHDRYKCWMKGEFPEIEAFLKNSAMYIAVAK